MLSYDDDFARTNAERYRDASQRLSPENNADVRRIASQAGGADCGAYGLHRRETGESFPKFLLRLLRSNYLNGSTYILDSQGSPIATMVKPRHKVKPTRSKWFIRSLIPGEVGWTAGVFETNETKAGLTAMVYAIGKRRDPFE